MIQRGITRKVNLTYTGTRTIIPLLITTLLLSSCIRFSSAPILSTPPASSAHGYIIQNAYFFDGENTDIPLPVRSLLIENGRIKTISSEPITDTHFPTTDAQGHTLLPGLIDMHVHFMGTSGAPWKMVIEDEKQHASAYTYAGITAALDLGSPEKRLVALKENIDQNKITGPEIIFAGRAFASKEGYPMSFVDEILPFWIKPFGRFLENHMFKVIDPDKSLERTETEIKEHIEIQNNLGATVIKVMIDDLMNAELLSQQHLELIVKHATQNNMTVIAHISKESHLASALDAGITTFSHIPFLSTLSPEIISRSAQANARFISALGLAEHISHAKEGMNFDPMTKSMSEPKLLKPLEQGHPNHLSEDLIQTVADVKSFREIKYDNAKRLKAAGVTLIPGSDSAFMGSVPGASLHNELAIFVEKLHYTPLEALALSTSVSGKMLSEYQAANNRVLRNRGLLQEGEPANFFLIKGDITQDIHRSTAIEQVFIDGLPINRKL